MSDSNVLPLLDFGRKLGVATLKLRDVVKLPLPRLAGGKSVARTLQGDLVVGVDSNRRESALAATRLADAVCCRLVGDRRLSSSIVVQNERRTGAGRTGSLHRLAAHSAVHRHGDGRCIDSVRNLGLLLREQGEPVARVRNNRLAVEHWRALEAVVDERGVTNIRGSKVGKRRGRGCRPKGIVKNVLGGHGARRPGGNGRVVDRRECGHRVHRKAYVVEVGHQACARVEGVVAVQVCGEGELAIESGKSVRRTCHVCDVVQLGSVVARAGEQWNRRTLA